MAISSFDPFKVYWRLYGGVHELVRSMYLWAALGITLMCSPFWLTFDAKEKARPATDLVLSTIPSLMAYTLGGMAILMALSGGKFLDAIREGGSSASLFLKIAGLFFHFLLVETLAFGFALVSKSYPLNSWIAAPTFFLMAYSVTSAISVAAMLINVAQIYNLTGGGDKERDA